MENYLNNAGAGIMTVNTYEAITNFLSLERKIGAYQAAAENKLLTDSFYSNAAKIINANSSNEIAFVDSASRGWNMVVYGFNLKKDDRVITLSSEFGTNLLTLFDHCKKNGAVLNIIKCDKQGDFLMDNVEEQLKHGARMIAISHATAHGSIINPVIEIGKLAKKYGATYIVDGCHAVGQFEVDVQEIQCDAYITTGRKWLCGPRGTGFLYVKEAAPFRTTQLDLASADLIIDNKQNIKDIEVRNDARQFELWEKNVANLIGLSTAINTSIKTSVEIISQKIQVLADQLRECALNNQNLIIIGKIKSASGILGFYLKDSAKEDILLKMLTESNLAFSTMGNWDCPLHFPNTGVSKIFRLSPHYYTNQQTIESACNIISRA